MKKLPTDLQILNAIYNKYYDEFAAFSKEGPSRPTKIYMAIDIEAIADDLGVDKDIVFGRLYYHLDRKHGYRDDEEKNVHLFALRIEDEKHCVNFPLVASVLAELRDNKRRSLREKVLCPNISGR